MRIVFRLILVNIFVLFLISCEREEIITDPDVRLNFSSDTVLFDTVFTSIGSTTKQLKVYNPYDQKVRISSVYLAIGDESNFRLNINGIRNNNVNDIDIPAKDSIYIFIEVTIDPTGVNTPMVVEDSIIFITNGNQQDVDLLAWGQDMHLINGEIISSQTWINDKPYLIYNSMMVDTGYTLTIEEGTEIYFHRNSSMLVFGVVVT